MRNFLKNVIRNIIRYKGYSLINILGLAIGLSCCILIFLYLLDELSYDKYLADPDQTFRIVTDFAAGDQREVQTARTPPPWAPVLARDFPEIESYVRIKSPLVSWMVSYEPANKRFYEKGFYFADETFLSFFNLKLTTGDPETALSKPSTVILTERMARKYFGNENPIGKVLRLDNSYDFQVTGIMEPVPNNSHFHCEFVASFITLHTLENGPYGQDYGNNMNQLFPDVYTYIRLPKNYNPRDFEKRLVGFVDQYHRETLDQFNAKILASLQPITSIHLQSNRDAELEANSDLEYIYIFVAIALFVLLIACINFMNLATARSAEKAREVAMRKVMGAERWQLMIHFIGESIIITLLALIVAVGLVFVLLPSFNSLSAKALSLSVIDVPFILGLFALIIVVGFVSGSYPAVFLSSFSPVVVLQSSSRTSTSSNAILRKLLVIFQFTISIVLLIGTGIVKDQMNFMQSKDLGFNDEQVIIISLGDTDQRLIFNNYKNLILQNPDVIAVSGLQSPPGGLHGNIAFTPQGAAEGETVLMDFFGSDHSLVEALEVDIIKGRSFSLDFPTDSTEAIILNESAVKHLGWQNEPIGKTIIFGPQVPVRPKVIGVVKDFHVKSLYSKIEPLVIGFIQQPVYLAIRIASKNVEQTLLFLEEKWPQVYPNDPFQLTFLDEDFDKLYQTEQVRGQVFGAFSILAILIACLGLLGLASFIAEQRTKEVGIRKVMGATVFDIIYLMTKEFVKLVLISSIIAWPIAYLIMNNWIQKFAYATNISLWTFILAALAAIIIAVLTVSFQAAKAALINPVRALDRE